MRAYYIHELAQEDVRRIKDYLTHLGHGGPIEDIYWFELPRERLTDRQRRHHEECGPYVFSLETGSTWIYLELLVRPRSTLYCSCYQYANTQQATFIMHQLEEILTELDIST